MANTTEPAAPVDWDGTLHSYRPAPDWRERIEGTLPLHTDTDAEIDPITYQVIRNRLYTINIAHGETVTRVSGSPVFQSLDFNMCILTEDAEYVMNAPFVQFLNSGAAFGISYMMERYASDPGIGAGDVYVCNDPWIGAVHQMDVLFAQPVFVDGQLFAWIASAGHQYDLGGIHPGGWPQNAPDAYSDPTVLSAFKLIEGGRMRPDLESRDLRQSRMPDMVALDMRAQIAGCRFAAEAIGELCEQFGAATVKGAMRRVLEVCQESFRRKLQRIPDGRWSEVRYLDEMLPGDRGTYPVQVNLTKVGDRLIVDNEGSHPQTTGPNGVTLCAISGAAVAALTPALLHEHLFAIGGAYRQIEFRLTPGLLNCVDYPAAVSAGVLSVVNQIGAVQACVNRMLACDEDLAANIVAPSPDYAVPVVSGENADGDFYGSAVLDCFAAGLGARSGKDGIDTAGHCWSPLTLLANVEDVEQWYPMIYLYRRELPDSGGAGRWRGGVGLAYAFMPHNARSMGIVNFGGGMTLSAYNAQGMLGGLPSPSAHALVRRGTNVRELFAARRVPADVMDLEATEEFSRPQKANEIPLGPTDVVEYITSGGGGYGDPLEREPWRVAGDVARGAVSVEAARTLYGVELDPEGAVDEDATGRLRAEIRGRRARWGPTGERFATDRVSADPATGAPPRRVHEAIVERDEGERRVLACERCDTVLCDYGDDFKRHILLDEGSVTQVPGAKSEPISRLDTPVVLRQYCCPGCQVLLGAEVARAVDEPWPDMRLGDTRSA